MNKLQLLQSLKEKGFSKQVIDAFAKIEREKFVPASLRERAYEDNPLPIGKGQTISQPNTTAIMLDLLELKKSQKILEIGSGSGYVLALMSTIVGSKGRIYGVEIVKELAEHSKKTLNNYKNIKIYNKSGKEGLKEEALFDRILISAAIEKIPRIILEQLKPNGLIVAPIGKFGVGQDLILIQRKKDKFVIKKKISGFVFVKFVED